MLVFTAVTFLRLPHALRWTCIIVSRYLAPKLKFAAIKDAWVPSTLLPYSFDRFFFFSLEKLFHSILLGGSVSVSVFFFEIDNNLVQVKEFFTTLEVHVRKITRFWSLDYSKHIILLHHFETGNFLIFFMKYETMSRIFPTYSKCISFRIQNTTGKNNFFLTSTV